MGTRSQPIGTVRWVPGHGADVLVRPRAAFPPPGEPTGEAWFMSERLQMFTQVQGDLTLVPVSDPRVALPGIASGATWFAWLSDEWPAWFHHLLGRVVPRAHEEHGGCWLPGTMVDLYVRGARPAKA